VAWLPEITPLLLPLSREGGLKLLPTQSVGRIGITVQALPVNFGLLGEAVVFRTIPGTNLDAATSTAVVAFVCDGVSGLLSSPPWSSSSA
jgi:nitroimidazol reductase NimA-like FMN-containing flavoprotein (pyridoxamine 5'-phosphate oxidase superfamily)